MSTNTQDFGCPGLMFFCLIVIRYSHLPVYDEASFLPPALLRHALDQGHEKAVASAV